MAMYHKKLKRIVFALGALCLAALGLAPQNSFGAAGGWAEEEQARVRLISATEALGGGAAALGLEFDLQPGWKIYWRSPGDA